MWFTRRALTSAVLRLSMVLGLPFPLRPAVSAEALPPQSVQTFADFLDTLIPTDGMSPSASSVNVDATILRRVSRKEEWTDFIRQGCAWLDRQAHQTHGSAFAALSDAAKEEIVDVMAKSPPDSFERRFFESWRRHAMRLFYAQPGSWTALGIEGPPQPMGHLDHTEPPGRL